MNATSPGARRAGLRGQLWALASAGGFGLIPVLARLGYDAGASPMAVVAGQLGLGALVLTAAMVATRRPWRMEGRSLGRTALVGLAWFLAAVCYLGSIVTIPVSLAVLILYTFPILTVIVAPLFDKSRLERLSLVAALLALAGLALALGLEVSELDPRGLLLAVLASLTTAATFVLSRQVVVDEDFLVFNAHLHLVCAALAGGWIALFGLPSLPAASVGWAAYVAVCLLYVVAVVLQFGAIRLAGAGRASIAFHAEPIVTLAAAALLLGELLGAREVAGASLVLVAIALATRAGR
jgi:drug/metabolite transporter (DMT)-like permease